MVVYAPRYEREQQAGSQQRLHDRQRAEVQRCHLQAQSHRVAGDPAQPERVGERGSDESG